jgi:hypothetical protein
MANENRTDVEIKSAGSIARELFSTAFKKLNDIEKAQRALADEERWFFPKGIEFISITATAYKITLELKVAGKEGIKATGEKGISDLLPPE